MSKYYVEKSNASKQYSLVGPFDTHEEALTQIERSLEEERRLETARSLSGPYRYKDTHYHIRTDDELDLSP